MSHLGAFSTLGCPELPAAQLVEVARELGDLGIELRVAPGSLLDEQTSPQELSALAATLGDQPLISLATYVRIGDRDAQDREIVGRLLTCMQLASALGAPAIRVFAGGEGTAPLVRRVRAALRSAPPGVEILLETHDSHSTGRAVAAVLEAVGDARFGAIWDVAHPWAESERPEETIESLWPWLRYVQLKDEPSPADRRPVFLGEGSIPLGRMLDLLAAREYAGAFSLEWERAWHPSIPPIQDAVRAAQRWLDARAASRA
jgi:beta-glucosidase